MSEKTILLIEDNPDDEVLALRALKRHQINGQVIVAHDGVEALDYLFCTGSYCDRSPDLPPSVILLDLKLPRIDGLEVLRRLRADQRTSLIPVVVLTTSSEDQDLRKSYTLGCNSYIRKPVDFVEFTEVVRQLGQYWLSLNQIPHSNS